MGSIPARKKLATEVMLFMKRGRKWLFYCNWIENGEEEEVHRCN